MSSSWEARRERDDQELRSNQCCNQPTSPGRRWLLVLLGVLSAVALVLFGRSLNATKRGGQGPAEPFRIAGNFYYVGASDVAAFLITGPEGHVVLDGGYPTTALMITASIAKLGFDIKDVKMLLNSEPHPTTRAG
jgi:metallo-beta-lactamase class B